MTDGEARAVAHGLLPFTECNAARHVAGCSRLTAHLLAIDAAHGVEVYGLKAGNELAWSEVDRYRSQFEAERDDARGAATGERNVLRRDLAAVLGERATLRARIATLEAEVADARGLLLRAVTYVKEDRAVTPGSSRLARLTDQIRAFLSPGPETPQAK